MQLSSTATAIAAAALRRGSRVLLVDDDAIVLRSVGRLLERRGYTVETAGSVGAALHALEDARFDAMICDVRMPDGGGEQLFESVATARGEFARRIVFVTGDATASADFLRRSGCPYLEKPYEMSDLIDILDVMGAGGGSTKG